MRNHFYLERSVGNSQLHNNRRKKAAGGLIPVKLRDANEASLGEMHFQHTISIWPVARSKLWCLVPNYGEFAHMQIRHQQTHPTNAILVLAFSLSYKLP